MSVDFRPLRSRRTRPWSVFDAVRSFPSTPEALMSEIDAAVASTEYTRSSPSPPPPEEETVGPPATSSQSQDSCYDAKTADEAYKAACAALAAKRPDAAVRSLKVALESCPPDKTTAVAKLRSLLSIANSQLQKSQQNHSLLMRLSLLWMQYRNQNAILRIQDTFSFFRRYFFFATFFFEAFS